MAAMPWAILGRVIRAEGEHSAAAADFTLPVELPPRIVIVAADRSAHPDPNSPDEYPYIIAAGSLCLLAHFAVAPSIGTYFSNHPDESHLVLVRHFDNLDGRITASAERVPDRAGHIPSLMNIGSVGLISDDEGEYYMIAELQVLRGCKDATLVCFESGNEQWYSEDVKFPLPEVDREWVPHGAVPIGNTLWWFDLSWGILSCNLSDVETELLFHRLPDGRVLEVPTEAVLTKRCIAVSQGRLRYVEIIDDEGEEETATVVMWTRIIGPDGWRWETEYTMSFEDIWNDTTYKETRLPRKAPVLVVVCPLDPDLVYFTLEQRLFGVCVSKHKVVHYETYKLVNVQWPPLPACSRYVLTWDLPQPQAVAPGAAALDKQQPVMLKDGDTTSAASDLPFDLIREHIYRILPASDVLCARLVNRNWNRACDLGYLGQIQPARGGSIPLGFLLSTDKLQRHASVGLKTRRHFKGLKENFPACDARIIASSCGLYLIHMRNPEGMVILNPAVGQSRTVYPPVSAEESDYTGMAVTFQDGLQMASTYSVVVPYRPPLINAEAENPRIRFRTWNSQDGVWRINPSIIDLGDFNPRNVVAVGDVIYYHISRDELVFYDLSEGQPGQLDMPLEVAGITEIALCSRQGALAIMSYDLADETVKIYALEVNAWIFKADIAMEPIVERNRFAFRSLLVNLRTRAAEDAWEALFDIQLIGYVDPGWLLIRQRHGWIIIDGLTKTARRVHVGPMQKLFWKSSKQLSTFVLVWSLYTSNYMHH